MKHIALIELTRIVPQGPHHGIYLTPAETLTSLKTDPGLGLSVSRIKFTVPSGEMDNTTATACLTGKGHVSTVIVAMGLFCMTMSDNVTSAEADREDISTLCKLLDTMFPAANKVLLTGYHPRTHLEARLKKAMKPLENLPKVVVRDFSSGMARVFRGYHPVVNYNTLSTWMQKELLI
jgi:hypothetical protein